MTIKVRAKSDGFYGTRRRKDAEFEVDSEKDLGSWMEVLDEPEPEPEPEPVAKPDDEEPSVEKPRRRGPGRPRKSDSHAE